MKRSGGTKRLVVLAAAGTVVVALALAGCNEATAPAPDTDQSAQSATVQQEPAKNPTETTKPAAPQATPATTYDEWIEQHPAQYESYAVDKIDENGKNHSHYNLRSLVENYDGKMKLNSSCIACKTTAYNDLYDEFGEKALALEFSEVKDKVEAYYDCKLCHVDSVSLTLKPASTYFANLRGDAFANCDDKTLVCGQCHNGLAFYRTPIGGDEKTFADFDPYRYGTDGEAVYKALLEDNCGTSPEEETGATIIRGTGENDLEVFEGSVHQSMGLSCVDCHMTADTDASGNEFTNHNASSSPLENEAALERCLECHKNQGIESTDAMVEFVENAQQEFVDKRAVVKEKVDAMKQLLTDATAAGQLDEQTLEQARTNYSQANFYMQFYTCNMKNDGTKIAHNASTCMQYLDRAEHLLDEGIALLS